MAPQKMSPQMSPQMSPSDSGFFEWDGRLTCHCRPNKEFRTLKSLQDHCDGMKHFAAVLDISLGYKPSAKSLSPMQGPVFIQDGMMQQLPHEQSQQFVTVFTELPPAMMAPPVPGPASVRNIAMEGYCLHGTCYFGEDADEMHARELVGGNPLDVLSSKKKDWKTGLKLSSMGQKAHEKRPADKKSDEKVNTEKTNLKTDVKKVDTDKVEKPVEAFVDKTSSWVHAQDSQTYKSPEQPQSLLSASHAGSYAAENAGQHFNAYYGFIPNNQVPQHVYPVNMAYNNGQFQQNSFIEQYAPPPYAFSAPQILMKMLIQPQRELGVRPSYGYEHYGPKNQMFSKKNVSNTGNYFNHTKKLNGNANVVSNVTGQFKKFAQVSKYPNHFDTQLHAAHVDPNPFVDVDGTSEAFPRCFGCPKAFRTFAGLGQHVHYMNNLGNMHHFMLKTGGHNGEAVWDNEQRFWVLGGEKVNARIKTKNFQTDAVIVKDTKVQV